MGETLIVYFSRAGENYFRGDYRYVDVGNTELAVRLMQKHLDADVLKLEMKEPYADDYMTCLEQAKADLKKHARPELLPFSISPENYTDVILAYPNYWGTIPMPVAAFLERYSWRGKTIYPLCTNEGSGMGSSERTILASAPGCYIKKGLSLVGSDVEKSESVIVSWLKAGQLI